MENIGIDIGFSFNKYAIGTGEGQFGKFPNAVAELRGNYLTTGDGIYELEGKYYYIGEKAIKQPRENIIEISDHSLMEKFAPLFIIHTINELGYDAKNVKCLGLGVSPAFIDKVPEFKKRCSNFTVNGINYNFDVKVSPQGLGAFKALEARKAIVNDDILLVDGGFNTVDVLFIYDGQVEKNRISADNSFVGLGVTRVAQSLGKLIKKKYGFDLSLKEAQFALDAKALRRKGVTYDLLEDVKECIDAYTLELMNEISIRYGSDMEKLESVYVVGGVAYLINPNIEGYPEGYIKTFKDSEYLNAMGNYVSASGDAKEKGKK
jgi:hypothetical protein